MNPIPQTCGILLVDGVENWSDDLQAIGLPPPFWAFAWAGGQGLARWLLDNPHRVRVTLRPEPALSERRMAAEAARLAKIRAALSDEEARRIREETAALNARQSQKDDPEILPLVTREDIPADFLVAEGQEKSLKVAGQPVPLAVYAQGTNGLVYEQMIIDLPQFTEREQELLPLYTSLVSELGAGDNDYMAMQQWQSRVSGGLRMSLSVRTDLHDAGKGLGHLVFSGKALADKAGDFNQLMLATLDGLRFDEGSRVRELVSQMRARWEASVKHDGYARCGDAYAASWAEHDEVGMVPPR